MSKTTLSWKDEVASRAEGLIGLRRDFHRHPELSMAERRTAGVIAERLQAAGLEVRTGSEATGAETAVVGILHGERPGRTIAWRADIDALPLNEIPDLPFKSAVPGAMHACGHDGHAAVAITMAEILAARRGELPGTAVFIFQPAEETLGGAQRMIEAGVLDDPPVEKVYGIHLTTLLPAGQVGVRPGPVMASSDFFEVEVKGSGGHGAYPHLSIDPITAASHILIGMQDLVSREIDPTQPAVMTIGEIKGGNRHNIIPETAIMRGSIRAFDQQVRDQLVERLGAYASRMARAYRAEARVTIGGQCCPAVVNPEDEAGHVHRCAAGEIGEEQVTAPPPVMGSDDMSLFLQARPGCYFWVGAAPADKPPAPHHHPAFELNEDSLAVGVRTGLAVMMGALAAP
ncbi:MAG: amidohydrolase [SAR324 cluster bacterium]|nr:amidohydrolase [SAR324 cluster bacterium]